MVVKKRRKPLSVIIESTECIHHSPPKVDFEYIRTSCVSDTGEALIARKADTGQVYSVKLTRKSGYNGAALAERMRREQKMLRVLTECCVHFVLRLFWSFEDERAMYLVTDRNDGRNLRSVVQMEGPLPAREAVLCAAELVEGISGLHAHGITHTGLRPESVLLGQDGHVVISDFDEAGFLYDDVERHLVPPAKAPLTAQKFRAPELLLQWEYDYAVDWWSFGLVLFWTLTGTHPFVDERDAENNAIVRAKVLHAPLTEDHLGMDENAHRLIFRCLQRNPAMRIDGVGVKRHEYFQNV
ncbi:kinase-like domain-containing protein [Trametes elegans]|nr:kinase-like domain-containing protein [Trametes elegans]